jgi:Xaa-Pro aminopeptidase
MKHEIDERMINEGVDALLVVGPAQHNPAMVYLTGGGHLTNADVIKKQGQPPVLFFNTMERDEAAKSGLKTIGYDHYPLNKFIKECNGDLVEAMAVRYEFMLKDCDVTHGKIALYGTIELGPKFAVLSRLQQRMPAIEFVGYVVDTILMPAMMTKDQHELARIRNMGKITTQVVQKTADFLQQHNAKDNVLITAEGRPLTIGDVKAKINLWLAEAGAENPHDTIFAIGRDAGVPHSLGTPGDALRLGETIVFDIFPCEAGGGYHYDFTRTWCLGFAPQPVQELYDQVYQVYKTLVSELKENQPFKAVQDRTCDLFEAVNHPTIRSKSNSMEGYVHSVGHGLGLRVHEMPFSGATAGENEILAKGSVFTIEPGLYYPDQGMGVRLEDTFFINENGQAEKFVDFPMDLVLPINMV